MRCDTTGVDGMADENAARTQQFMRLFVANQRKIYGLIVSLVPHLRFLDEDARR